MRAIMIALIAASVTLQGCAAISLGAHQPSMDTVVLLRDSGISKLDVGTFSPSPTLPAAADKSVSVRGSTLRPPDKPSFALYLRQSLIADLTAAGKFEPAAPVRVQAELTENKLNAAGASSASAELAATFRVTRNEQLIYEKKFVESPVWKSSFVGAIAFPEAVNHYTESYSQLLLQLYRDDAFIKACR